MTVKKFVRRNWIKITIAAIAAVAFLIYLPTLFNREILTTGEIIWRDEAFLTESSMKDTRNFVFLRNLIVATSKYSIPWWVYFLPPKRTDEYYRAPPLNERGVGITVRVVADRHYLCTKIACALIENTSSRPIITNGSNDPNRCTFTDGKINRKYCKGSPFEKK